MGKTEITIQDILVWVMQNSDDIQAMDKINKATFPFSSAYSYRKKQ
jgi:hypothetical protein